MICSMSNVGGGGGESSLQIQFLGIDAFKVRFFVFMVSSHFIILEVGRIWPEKDTPKSILTRGAIVVVGPDTVVFASINIA